MFPAANYVIEGHRYAPHADYLDFVGYDFTSAVFAMQIRDTRNGGTLRETIVPTVSVSTDDGITTSRVSWSLTEADMEAMPLDPAHPDADVTLYYDIHITPSGGTKFVAARGTFVVLAGATD